MTWFALKGAQDLTPIPSDPIHGATSIWDDLDEKGLWQNNQPWPPGQPLIKWLPLPFDKVPPQLNATSNINRCLVPTLIPILLFIIIISIFHRPLVFTIWFFRPYKTHIFWNLMSPTIHCPSNHVPHRQTWYLSIGKHSQVHKLTWSGNLATALRGRWLNVCSSVFQSAASNWFSTSLLQPSW